MERVIKIGLSIVLASWLVIAAGGQAATIDRGCDLFKGKWVADQSYPLYNSLNCPFIDEQLDCLGNGRPDRFYLHYRWQPINCRLPSFDGRYMLKRLNGKKILFVGDSLSKNQWQSLACMLHAAVPKSNFTISYKHGFKTLTFPEYRASIVLSTNNFLVDIVKEKVGRVLKLDSIKSGSSWLGYDFLVFNTWHWWLHKGSSQPWDYIQRGNVLVKDMDRLEAFKHGLTTWSNWVDSHISPSSMTKVFFQGISPIHYNGKDWKSSNRNCIGETRPLNGTTYPTGEPPEAAVVKSVLKRMSTTRVSLLDITTLSQLRKDGHPSQYGHKTTSKSAGRDCSHWCVAGVPDTWNQLFYTMLFVTRS